MKIPAGRIANRFCFAWICLLTVCHPLFADESFAVRNWQTENGLPQNSIRAIAQTPDGFLWLGTSEGLVRFDGLRFTPFTGANSPGFDAQIIYALAVDPSGVLWLGTDRGLSRYSAGEFKNFTTREGLTNSSIDRICVDGEGSIWAAGDSGLNRIKNGVISTFQPSGKKEWIRDLACDRSGRVWAMPTGGGLYCFENGRFEQRDPVPNARDIYQGFFQDRKGDYWTGRLYKGLARWNTNGLTLFTRETEIPDADLVSHGIAEDASGTLWFSFPPTGLARLVNGKFERFGREQGLPSIQVRSLFADRENNLWVGTADSGLVCLRPKSIQNLNDKQGIPLFTVRAICDDGEGGLWVANEHNGLYRYSQGAFKKIGGGAGGSLWSLLLTTYSGLVAGKYPNGIAWLPIPGPPGPEFDHLPCGHIRAMIEDRNRVVWIATENGIFKSADSRLLTVTKFAAIQASDFSSLIEDREGAIWAGSESAGVFRVKDGVVEAFGKSSGLRSEWVRCLCLDDEGTLWAGTSRGLSRFKNGRFGTAGRPEGLPDERVNQILDDGLGNLWFGTHTGIYRTGKKELDGCLAGERPTIHPLGFGKQDGLLSLEFRSGSQPTSVRGDDGKLYFLTLKSIAVIDPKTIEPDVPPSAVVLESVWVDERESLSGPVGNLAKNLVIKPGLHRVEYHFTGLSLSAPERVRYRYRLEGYDEGWIDSGTRRFASYTRIPPGKYTFRVSAATGDSAWTAKEASLAVVAQPFFWQTRTFQVLAVVALLAAGYGVYRRRLTRLERLRLQQQAFSRELIASQERERKRLAGELHDGLGQVLVIIKNRAAAALLPGEDQEATTEQLREISQMATEGIEEVRTISRNLRPYQLDRLGMTMALKALVKQFAAPSCVLSSEIDPIDKLIPQESEINFYRIIQECLNNIGKHSGAKNASLAVLHREGKIAVTIRDDGKGFDFHGIMNDPTSKRGLGITGLQERARSLGAELRIESTPGQGTCIRLDVPVVGTPRKQPV
jgi:signal transduction histidine kinase/ligand-binding sensor domain-containing protein